MPFFELFFPCLHIHDGHDVPAVAHYDHHLYCQAPEKLPGWTMGSLPRVLHPMISSGMAVQKMRIRGNERNRDVIVSV